MSETEETGTQGIEKRKHYRVDVQIEITLTSEHNFYTGFIENISSGGLFISTYDYRPRGTLLSFSFVIPGFSEPFEAQGEVMWVKELNPAYPESVPGMGIAFTNLNSQESAMINDFLQAHREPMFFDSDD